MSCHCSGSRFFPPLIDLFRNCDSGSSRQVSTRSLRFVRLFASGRAGNRLARSLGGCRETSGPFPGLTTPLFFIAASRRFSPPLAASRWAPSSKGFPLPLPSAALYNGLVRVSLSYASRGRISVHRFWPLKNLDPFQVVHDLAARWRHRPLSMPEQFRG